jgi:hypothetical protein
MERYLRRSNPEISGRIRALRVEAERELGLVAAAINRVLGPPLLWASRREGRVYPSGRAREPRTFVERRLSPAAR